MSQALRKLIEVGLLTALIPRPPPQPLPPQFRMDLHCAYHQGSGHETNRCTALRHVVQDLIDQDLVHLGQSSVTQNPLPTHTVRVVPLPTNSMHSIDFAEFDDHIHMLSWDEPEPEPIVSDEIHGIGRVTLGPWMSTPFRLTPEVASVQTTTIEPLTFPHYSVRTPFVLISNVVEVKTQYVDVSQTPHVDDAHTSNVQYVIRGGRVIRQQPPAATRPLEGTSS